MEGLSEWVVRSPAEVYQLMANGQAMVSSSGACFRCSATGKFAEGVCLLSFTSLVMVRWALSMKSPLPACSYAESLFCQGYAPDSPSLRCLLSCC